MKLKLLNTFLLAAAFMTSFAQQGSIISISGTVTDVKDGSPMPGVNVIVDKTSQGTITGIDGKYSLKIDNANATLVISFIGYTSQKIALNGQTVVNAALQEDVMKLDEIVVTGYGTSKKKDITGSLVTLKADDLNQTGAITPEQMFQGKVSGVQIVANNGEPGAGMQIKIRGASSIRSGQQPLYVIDGIPFDMQSTSPDGINGNALGGAPATSPLTSINPNDIESIDILKDASAAAIYGSRGANGVIIITTKKGKEGVSEVNYSATVSFSKLPKKLDVLSGSEWAKYRKDSMGITDNNFGANTNWQDQIYRTAISQNHSLSLSGGTLKTTYCTSFNYSDQQGIIDKTELKRYSGHLNMTQKTLNDKLLFEAVLSGSQIVDERGPVGATGFEGDLILNALQANPTWPVRDSLGNPFQGNGVYNFSAQDRNPVAMLQYTSDLTRETNLLGKLSATLEIIKDLNYKMNFGVTYNNSNRFINQSQKLSYMAILGGEGQINNRELYNYVIEHTLNYNKTLGFQTIGLLAGYSYQDFNVRTGDMSGGNYATDGILYTNLIQAGSSQANWNISSSFDNYRMQSYFGRINYDLMEKYLFTATIRADGSTKFGENNKYGYFPSFAVGWRMSEESFIKDLNLFSNLKLRLGWGETGNSEIGTKNSQYLYQNDDASKAIVGGTTILGLKVAKTPNPGIKWETTTSSNLGIDFGVLKGKLSGTVDLYQKTTSNLLLTTPSAPLSPTSDIVRNMDSVKVINKGAEFSLTGVIISKSKLSWDITGIISFLSNEVTGLNKAIYGTGSAQGQGLTDAWVEVIANNQPTNEFYGVKMDSIDKKGNVWYIKKKGYKNPRSAPDSLTYLGNPQPKFIWSLTNNFKFMSFDLNVFIDGVYGNKIFNNTALLLDKNNLNQSKNTLRYLFNDKIPTLTYTPTVSDRYVEDGSYMRLSSVTLGYNLNIKSNPWVKKARIYFSGSNLLVMTKYKGYDPDVSNGNRLDRNGVNSFGIDITSYPKARTYVVGLNVTF